MAIGQQIPGVIDGPDVGAGRFLAAEPAMGGTVIELLFLAHRSESSLCRASASLISRSRRICLQGLHSFSVSLGTGIEAPQAHNLFLGRM